ncbi:MAG: tetratricopeptide repeat protein, partial [Candidatus Poribacteria bacterium]
MPRIYRHALIYMIGIAFLMQVPNAQGKPEDEALRAYDEGLRFLFNQNGEKAFQAFQRAVSLDSALADAHYRMGLLYGLKSQWTLAIVALQSAIDADENHVDAYCQLGEA